MLKAPTIHALASLSLLTVLGCSAASSSSTTPDTAAADGGADATDSTSDGADGTPSTDATDEDAVSAENKDTNGADGASSDDAVSTDDDATVAPEDTATEQDTQASYPKAPEALGGDRPAAYFLPDNYDSQKAWPLVLLLHGYSATGYIQNIYLGVSARTTEDGFILVVPEGTPNSEGKQFWNATDACCNFENTPVDDVAYLTGLVTEAEKYFHIDPARVYSFGHSNGGFMSYRLACEASDVFAGIVSLAGSTWKNDAKCPAGSPVSVLQVHGTKDETIAYEGEFGYPSAKLTAEAWAKRDGCEGASTPGDALDLEAQLAGAETKTESWQSCSEGTTVALWTLEGGSHVPGFNGSFTKDAIAFLLSHSKALPE